MARRRYLLPHQYWESDEEIRVDEVLVHGSPYTQQDVFDIFLANARAAQSANELHSSLMKAHDGLMRLGIFKSVRFLVDCARGPRHTNIAVVPEEIPRKEYGVGVGGGGPDTVVLTASLGILNTFGRGEHWRSTLSHSAPGSAEYVAYDGTFWKPLLYMRGPMEHAYSLGAHYSFINRQAESRHTERRLHVDASYELTQGAARSTLRLADELRQLTVSHGASVANLDQGGWTNKATLGYEWQVDTRDTPLLPSRGTLGKGLVELALDPQNARPLHVKAEVGANVAVPLEWGSVLLRMRGGHILGHFNSVDAFHLGGAHMVPGFCVRGMGRTPGAQESLGAGTYWLATAHYFFGLGGLLPEFLKGHVHASACGLSNTLGTPAATQGVLTAFSAEALRASAGVGIVAAMEGAGRLTFTWSRVLRAHADDSTTSFLQFGFTTSFE